MDASTRRAMATPSQPSESWTKMNWNALLISMELRAETDQTLTPILRRHWDLYQELLLQPERPQQVRLSQDWAKVLACISWDWLYANSQVPARNQSRIACKWCKQEPTITMSITARAMTPMGHLVAGPYRTCIKLDNGFLNQPLPRDSDIVRQPHQIRQALSLSLPRQTRDAVFGIIHTRSVYTEQVPRVMPSTDRRMTAGGTIQWERTHLTPAPSTPMTNSQGETSEHSPEPLPDSEDPEEAPEDSTATHEQRENPQSASPLQWTNRNSWIR